MGTTILWGNTTMAAICLQYILPLVRGTSAGSDWPPPPWAQLSCGVTPWWQLSTVYPTSGKGYFSRLRLTPSTMDTTILWGNMAAICLQYILPLVRGTSVYPTSGKGYFSRLRLTPSTMGTTILWGNTIKAAICLQYILPLVRGTSVGSDWLPLPWAQLSCGVTPSRRLSAYSISYLW